MGKILVAGAGGFIGGHLVQSLIDDHIPRENIVAVDIKPNVSWWQEHPGVQNVVADLSKAEECIKYAEGCSTIYNLAADMGGMGFIENNKALCMISVLINTHLLQAARLHGVQHYFYASSACVYAADMQRRTDASLREEDAYPASPEDGYGWEKLFSERMCRHFHEDFGIDIRVARFHNVYGPRGSWNGGREKAPAAICRKVALAKATGDLHIDIWGDGEQTRSFMFIDDCISGIHRICKNNVGEPINLGSSEMVTINELVSIAEEIAGITCERRYNLSAPKGVRGRNSDNTKIKEVLGWEPTTTLREGLEKTFHWIDEEMNG